MRRNKLLVLALVLPSLMISCHKEDNYRMGEAEFASTAVSGIAFEQMLLDRLQTINTDPVIAEMVLQRNDRYKIYLSEVQSMVSLYPTIELSQDNKKLIQELDQTGSAAYQSAIYTLLMKADEQLISVHIKATTSEGLKNAEMRNWAHNKLAMFVEDLSHSQSLKR